MSENFNRVDNFNIYKKLKILKISENKNPKLQSLTIQNKENKHLFGFFLKFKICLY